MKRVIWGLVRCVLVCVLSIAIKAYAIEDKDRFHQHIEAEEKVECTNHGEDVFCSHLPLIEITTDGKEIPGKAVRNDEGVYYYTTTEDGESTIMTTVRVVDNYGKMNHYDDKEALSTLSITNVRGHSSRRFDKSSYRLEFVNKDGSNNDIKLMGMDAHHTWVLHGPFLDKSLIRNYMWYNIAGEIMDYAPNVRFCELFLNGEYKGVYVATEKITAGENGARLNLEASKKHNTYTGYLICMDRATEGNLEDIESFSGYALRRRMNLEVKYPGNSQITEEMVEAIGQDFSDFEKALYSYDFDNADYGYEKFIDVDSFADYFILNEFTCNYDAGWLSTYMYKDSDGKYRMCIWDFNSACDNYHKVQFDTKMGYQFQNDLWYVMLMKDEKFNQRIIERYRQLRKGVLSDEYLLNYIDDVVEYLGDAVDRNFEVWGYTFEPDYYMISPLERNPRSHEQAVQQMKDFIVRRGAFMDENIESILQYSAGSRMKKFNENAN